MISASTPPAAATVFLFDAFTHRLCKAPAAESCVREGGREGEGRGGGREKGEEEGWKESMQKVNSLTI